MTKLIVLTLIIFSSCGADFGTQATRNGGSTQFLTGAGNNCSCPISNTPVCGTDRVIYTNSCLAQCAGVSWSNNLSNCTPCSFTSGQVCGDLDGQPTVFSNECDRERNNATPIAASNCSL